MPRIRTAFTRGLAATWSSPWIVGSLVVWLLLEWVALVALGYPGPVVWLAHVSAATPLGAITDLTIAIGVLGLPGGLLFVAAPAAVHALWLSALGGLAVEAIETGSTTPWGAVRGLRAFPVVLALRIAGVGVIVIGSMLASVGGSGLALLLQMGAVVVAAWLLAFAPVIAITEHRSLRDCLGRSIRAARLPGSGNLTFTALSAVPIFATFLAPGVPGALLGVNPPAGAWVFVVVVNLLHSAVLGAVAMRYLAVADEVPDAPVRSAPARGRQASSTARSRR